MTATDDSDRQDADNLERALRRQLIEIEREEVPDRLLTLARKLQDLLRERSRKAGDAEAGADCPEGTKRS